MQTKDDTRKHHLWKCWLMHMLYDDTNIVEIYECYQLSFWWSLHQAGFFSLYKVNGASPAILTLSIKNARI